MGWTYTHKAESGNLQDFFQNRVFGDKYQILKSKLINMKTWYAAVKHPDGHTFAAVFLVDFKKNKNDNYNFGWKDMDESCGPNEAECPADILDLLVSPPSNEYAKQWREKCRANLAKKEAAKAILDGQKILFSSPIHFTDGSTLQEFTLTKTGKSIIFRNNGRGYRITNWKKLDFAVVN